ncbi:hypothetical protein EYI23_15225 [Bacillus subtilis]|nr:DUF6270 domain-containing protein [Bacillus stercoris]AUS11686.1 hypothetical protein C0W65_06405 [Bacillus subtilis]NLS89291.1 hypothetical protein [Bacillus subtilis]WIL34957.1 DUF6270 domain-containing protein [Bacillus stercoris]
MKKVAVYGSCVTRDNFNSQFNADYKNFFDCVLTQNQSSIISTMSKPNYIVIDNENMSNHEKNTLKTDFENSFLTEIKSVQPDILILDFFADVHFGYVEISSNQYITNNRWTLPKTNYYKLSIQNKKQSFNIEDHFEKYFSLWKQKFNLFYNYVKLNCPDIKIMLNSARNVHHFFDKEEKKKLLINGGNIKIIDVDYYNRVWSKFDAYVLDSFSDVEAISLFENKKYNSYENHPWGKFYVHYTMDYYTDFLDQLKNSVFK